MVRQVREKRRQAADGDSRLRRAVFWCAAAAFLWSGPARAQNNPEPPPSLDALAAGASQKEEAWLALEKRLEGALARMLPCDERAQAGIQKVRAALEARLEAWSKYYAAWREQLNKDLDWCDALTGPAGQARLAELEADAVRLRAEASQARAASPALDDTEAAAAARALAARTEDRARQLEERRSQWQAAIAKAAPLKAALEERLKFMTRESDALDASARKWRAYYAARSKRGEIECKITNQEGAAAPPPDAAANGGAKDDSKPADAPPPPKKARKKNK